MKWKQKTLQVSNSPLFGELIIFTVTCIWAIPKRSLISFFYFHVERWICLTRSNLLTVSNGSSSLQASATIFYILSRRVQIKSLSPPLWVIKKFSVLRWHNTSSSLCWGVAIKIAWGGQKHRVVVVKYSKYFFAFRYAFLSSVLLYMILHPSYLNSVGNSIDL